LFPSVWVLLVWFLALGWPYFRELRPATVTIAAAAIVCVASFTTYRRMASFREEPPATLQPVADRAGAIYSSAPAASQDGIVFESIGHERYELERWKAGIRDTYSFDGEAFHPSVAPSGGAVYFELVSDGRSRIMAFDPPTRGLSMLVSPDLEPTHPAISPDDRLLAFLGRGRIFIYSSGHVLGAVDVPGPVHDVSWFPDSARLAYSAGPLGESQIYSTDPPTGAPIPLTHGSGDHTEPAVSPDGRWLAFTLERGATRQVWIRPLDSGAERQITQGACNSYSPAWEPDSQGIILASDCELGLNLPSLYRWTFGKSTSQSTQK